MSQRQSLTGLVWQHMGSESICARVH